MPQRTGIKFAEWKYQKHRAQSKFRGIDFNFTFDDWMKWWASHGVDKTVDTKWPPKTRPCMARYNDTGPYEVNNVYCTTHDQNVKDAIANNRHNPNGKKTALNYRWGSELVTLETLQTKYKIEDEYERRFYYAKDYDDNRKKECKKLTKQWHNIPIVVWWETDLGCYKTLRDAADFEGIKIIGKLSRSRKTYIHKANPYPNYKKHEFKISLENYIRKNSRFPDPLLEV